ncbi:uncharacterized protein LOC127249886 [Andrographis paniculata]|uniref:uncharacterized protein LOC127249886 n=1 Tax=Andrographis paniculata TaxID=175694 RepID=UPI0021E8E7AA|nr:uncharacterized protein LOC127249886 [Andrographis paniculata]
MEILFTPPPSRSPIISARTLSFSIFPKFAAIVLFLHLPLTCSSDEISYSDHCSAVVPDPPSLPEPNHPIDERSFLDLRNAYVYLNGSTAKQANSVIPRSLSLNSYRAYRTGKDAVFRIEASLSLTGVQYSRKITRRGLRLVHIRPPKIPLRRGNSWNSISFMVKGVWDSIAGKLCMVGSGVDKLSSSHVVLKLDYMNSSNIFTALVNGTLESVGAKNKSEFNLDLISILGVQGRYYEYGLIDKEVESNGFSMLDDMSNVSFGLEELDQKMCTYIQFSGTIELEYESDCFGVSCNILGRENGNFTPSMMYFDVIECLDDGRVRVLLVFGDIVHNVYRLPFQPNVTLISEGIWDEKRKRLNMVACRISTSGEYGFVRDCSIRLSVRFPARLTLRDRSAVVGELWSSKSANESGYFGRVSVLSTKNKNTRSGRLKYEYTEIEKAGRACANKTVQKGGGVYPGPYSSDMRFDLDGRNKKVQDLWGYASPYFVDNWFYKLSSALAREADPNWQGKQNLSDVTNISYVLSLSYPVDFELSREHKQIKTIDISAEGTYNSKTGHLCMTGCLDVVLPIGTVRRKSLLDCKVLVDIHYSPLHDKKRNSIKGTIESTRDKSDRFYFEPFAITANSIYAGQAKETIWRMDLEIAMVLISSTLSCIFTGLQLLHVKNHADGVPFISVVMLVLLTTGHLIPLLLNFEALFMNSHSNVNARIDSDGWLEVNEVFVRVITMVAFLLEVRLLQVTCSARSGDRNRENLWKSDKKVLYLSSPLYIGGGLIAWFVPILKNRSLWGGFKSYAGLILDGFLLPQMLFNIFSDSNVKALATPFYVGTTLVRLLPHAYDLYRSRSSILSFNYIYANPRLDYYSTAWDLVISIAGLVFVAVIYLQQRYGGRCLLPKALWQKFSYEKVPVSTTV